MKREWFAIADPSSSCFAWLFACIVWDTANVYCLDEIYEKDSGKTATTVIWPEARAKMLDLHPVFDDWHIIYDEAETWFAMEMMRSFNIPVLGSGKKPQRGAVIKKNTKTDGIDLIKTIMLSNQLKISERCQFLIWEISRYRTKGGKYVKKDDHQIDNLRALLRVSNYHHKLVEDEYTPREPRRAYTMEQDFQDMMKEQDWTITITEDDWL